MPLPSTSSTGGDSAPSSALPASDATAVAAGARQRDPGLPPETADLLSGQAVSLLEADAELDAPALARELMSANPDVGATAANVVATATVSFRNRSAAH